MSTSSATTPVPPKLQSSSPAPSQPAADASAQQRTSSASASKPASPAILNYAQAVGKTSSSAATSAPVTQAPPQPPPPSSIPPPSQTTPPANVPPLNSYPNGTTPPAAAVPVAPKAVIPPTGPAALNGSRNHSRASSTASSYRPTPPTGPHSAKPSMSGQGPYVPVYPSQSPRNGRNSPYPVDYHDESRSPQQQARNGSIAMARHGSQSSQSGGGQIPPSPRPANNRPPNVPQQYSYGYPNQQPFNPAYNHQPPPMQGGRGGFNRQSVSYQPGMQGQFRSGQPPTRSPRAQPIQMAPQMAPQMPQMQQMSHMYQVPMAAPGAYVFYPYPLGDSNFEYLPGQTDQFGNPQMQPSYVYAQPYHPASQPPLQGHGYPPTGVPPPPPPPQMFSPPPQAPSYTASPAPPRPMNQPMSRSTSVASDMNHQPPQHVHPPATPSPAPKEEAPTPPAFVIPKRSSAVKIVDPNTKAEVTFIRPTKSTPTAPDRTPSPAKVPVKHAAGKSLTHSPSPSLEERPPSVQKTRGEIAEEMKAKVKASMEETKRKEEERKKKEAEEEEARRKQAEKEDAERLERERIAREKKEEEERIAREKKEQEERLEKERLEQERIQREKEEEERRKAEEERIAKVKAEEEERLAKEKAEKEAAEAAQLAKEKEEEEAREKEREAAAAATAAATAAAAATVAASEEPSVSPERRSSVGQTKSVPPSLSITPVSDGLQAAALKKASFITGADVLLKYPDGINAPNPQVIQTFGQKGFHYDPEFLIQFKDIWKDKPSEDWDSHIKETMGDLEYRSQRPLGGVPRGPSSGSFSGGGIGNFSIAKPVPPRSNIPSLTTFTPIQPSFPSRGPGRIVPSGPSASQSPVSPRAPSAKQKSGSRRQPPPPPPPPPEPPIEPLVENPNRWKPRRQETTSALGPPPGGDGKFSPEVVQRKVKALLNKLTLEKFDKITDQILEIASQSRLETDGRTLRQIIQLTFEKATDEPNFSEMYALFCRKIMETIDPNITDPTVVNRDGQPLTGGQLFRKYLLNRCQEEFERGWKVNLPPKPDENELLSDEYYLAAKAKRQGLGLVQFIGELFKLNMLIEKIMYECIIRLLGGTDNPHPEPEEVESLCRLLVTVGKPLDEGKAKGRMNAIYEALDQTRLHSDLESRIKFKILDVLELRKSGWTGRTTGPQGPKTLQEIHDDAAKAKAEQDAARQTQRNRPEFGRGDARQDWGSMSRPKVDNRAGDMSKLGMLRSSSSSGLGPQTSQFNSIRTMSSRNRTAAGNTLQREGSGQSSRTGTPGVDTPPNMTSANSFDIFRNESESKEEEVSSPPTRKISVPTHASPEEDEVAEGGYYTIPPMQRVAGTASVANFVIHRKGFGSIHFKAEVDLTSISSLTALRELVKIERGLVTMYPDESKKPSPGNGLNVPAKIVLEKVPKPPDFEMDEFLEDLKAKPDQEFVSYESATWTYQVEHF